jgi:uncharacterized OB-fold protein
MLSPVKIWRNQKKIADLIGITGVIVSWTFIRVPPAEFSSLAPYPVVLVALDDGRKLMLTLVDYAKEDLTAGRKVITVLRRVAEPDADGVILYYVKAKPI